MQLRPSKNGCLIHGHGARLTSVPLRRCMKARASAAPSPQQQPSGSDAAGGKCPFIPGRVQPAPAVSSRRTAYPGSPSGQNLPLPDGPKYLLPLVGESFELMQSPLRYGLESFKRWGPIFKSNALGKDVYVLTSMDTITQVLKEDGYTVAFNATEAFSKLLGEYTSATMADTEVRRSNRRTLQPAFANDALASYVPTMDRLVKEGMAAWADKGRVEVREALRYVTIDMANELLVGLQGLSSADKDALQVLLNDFFNGLNSVVAVEIPGTTFAKAMQAKRQLVELLRPKLVAQRDMLFAERKVAGANGEVKTRKSSMSYVVDSMVNNGYTPSDDEMAMRALGLLIAGVDTSSTSFTSLVCALMMMPEVVEKLREEQTAVVAKFGDDITKEALDAMPYTEAVVREALYVYPSTAVNLRMVLEDLEVAGHRVPKGSNLLFVLPSAQAMEAATLEGREPEAAYVPEGRLPGCLDREFLSKAFKPERWLDGRGKQRPTLLTFHYGPHTCLGMVMYILEAKTLLARLARTYKLTLVTAPEAVPWREFPLPGPEKPDTIYADVARV